MKMNAGPNWLWLLNLGVPLILLAFAYGCGGTAMLGGETLHPAITALEGRPLAARLASRWDPSAQLVKVEGGNVLRNGRLAEKPDSVWIYTFSRPLDGAFYEVRRDGRGTVDAGPKVEYREQSLWEEALETWRVDSPVVAAHVSRGGLPVSEAFGMELGRDGVWRVSVEDGLSVLEMQIDARTGKRLL
jgi:hypothetical protein